MTKYLHAMILSATLLSVAGAQGMDNMPGMNMGSSTTMTDMNDARAAALQKLSGKAFDRAFLSMMIPHHQAAVAMSQAVLPKSKDATVQKWAKAIIAAQNKEIGEMQTWLKALGGTDQKMAAMMNGMQDMAGAVKTAKDPDLAFVQGMVGHHLGAISMATVALQKSADPRVLNLARDIVRTQAQEMYDFRLWLLKR